MVAKAKDEKLPMASSSTSPTQELKKGPWKPEEDMILIEYVKKHGERDWNMVRKHSGLARCGKSCRLRWNNHLRPNLRKGPFSPEEEKLICELHSKIGNKWARIAAMLPGRTDNEIKNFWNTRIKRLARKGAPLYPADIQSSRPDLINPYLHHLDGQNNPSSSSSPPSTSSSSNLQSNLQTQLSPTTPTSHPHPLLFQPQPSSSQHQFCHYDDVLQQSMALYDAALENSRQRQHRETIASSLQRYKRHRSVPNLTISVPPVRHVALHPFSPLGFSTTSSPLGRSVSMASSPTTSYMQLTPSPPPRPHSYTSSPTGMVVSPTALQLGIPQPSFRLPPLSSRPVMNVVRPTCLPRTSSFSFDPMMFDLNPTMMTSHVQHHDNQSQIHPIDAIDNELAFSVEDLGISMEPEANQSSDQVNDTRPHQPAVNGAAGPLDEFLKEAETAFDTDQATAFLNELAESDWTEAKLNRTDGGLDRNIEPMQELELHEDLSNLLGSTELPDSFWDNSNGLVSDNGVLHSQALETSHHQQHESYQVNNNFVDDHMGMDQMHQQLGSSVPVAASSSWDNMPGIYYQHV